MNKLFSAVFGLSFGLLVTGSSFAQTSCIPQSQTQLLLAFSDSSPAGSITPQVMRNFVCSVPTLASVAASQTVPASPTGTTSQTGVMMGLGAIIVPQSSGTIIAIINGTVANATGIGDGAQIQFRYGTGGAPSNGNLPTGTNPGPQVNYVASTTAGKVPFSLSVVIPGLTLGVSYWFDADLFAVSAGTATITNTSISLVELP